VGAQPKSEGQNHGEDQKALKNISRIKIGAPLRGGCLKEARTTAANTIQTATQKVWQKTADDEAEERAFQISGEKTRAGKRTSHGWREICESGEGAQHEEQDRGGGGGDPRCSQAEFTLNASG